MPKCDKNKEKAHMAKLSVSLMSSVICCTLCSVLNYIISLVVHAFWLVLTHDLLEDRRIDEVIIKTNSILYYIKQIDSKLPCVCSVIDHRVHQNVVRTSVRHLAVPHVPLFCSYHILMSSVIYYWTDTRQLGIYLLTGVHLSFPSVTRKQTYHNFDLLSLIIQ